MDSHRLSLVKSLMDQHEADQIIISDPATIYYLTGKWFSPGERLLVLVLSLNDGDLLMNNELFPLAEDPGVPVILYKDTDPYIKILSKHLTGSVIAVDKSWPARFLLPLMELAPGKHFILGSPIADGARLIKDSEEQELMRHASSLNDSAMTVLAERVSEKLTEKELEKQLLEIYQELGADDVSFTPIIAYGANGADPHHETDTSLLKTGDSIIFDIGCKKNSYCSDMTRTYFFREVSEEGREVYETVKEANLRAIAKVRPGNRFSEVDRAARDYITQKGYGPYFTHRTGHGIGIDIHEPEDVSAINDHVLVPGMIFSVEPGIYLPGKFGVRIEDLVLVTETGCEVLNEVSKDLKILQYKD